MSDLTKEWIRWISIVITALGTTIYTLISIQPVGLSGLSKSLLILFVIPPLVLFVLYFLSRLLLNRIINDRVQRRVLLSSYFLISCALILLIKLIGVDGEGIERLQFGRWSEAVTESVLDNSIGYLGLIILFCSWLATLMSIKQRQTVQSLIPFFFVLFLILLTVSARYFYVSPGEYFG